MLSHLSMTDANLATESVLSNTLKSSRKAEYGRNINSKKIIKKRLHSYPVIDTQIKGSNFNNSVHLLQCLATSFTLKLDSPCDRISERKINDTQHTLVCTWQQLY
jgi:hypothetical protein